MHTVLRTSLSSILAVALLSALAACDQISSTGEGKVWTITTESGRDGPRLTLKTECKVEDEATGKLTPLEVQVRGDATPDWGTNPMTQVVTIKLVSVGGPVIPEETLIFLPDGNKRTIFGAGQTASEIRQTAQGSLNCPTFVAAGPAAIIRTLAGSQFAVGAVGALKFRLDDEQIRGMSELLRRIDNALPR